MTATLGLGKLAFAQGAAVADAVCSRFGLGLRPQAGFTDTAEIDDVGHEGIVPWCWSGG